MHRKCGIIVGLSLMAAVWGVPALASAQGRPVFGSLDAGGMPSALIELKQHGKSDGFVLECRNAVLRLGSEKDCGRTPHRRRVAQIRSVYARLSAALHLHLGR